MTTPRTIRVVLRPLNAGTDAAFSASQRRELEVPELEELGVFVVFDGSALLLEAFDDQTLHTASDPEPRAVASLGEAEPVRSADGWQFSLSRQADGAWELVASPSRHVGPTAIPAPHLDDPLIVLPTPVLHLARERATEGQGDVSAGLLLRFGQTTVPGILAGQDRPMELVSDWWEHRSDGERAQVARHALSLADAIAATCRHLATTPDDHTPAWTEAIAAVCLQRDLLASIRITLRKVDAAPADPKPFEAADRALRHLLAGLVSEVRIQHPFLRFVARERGSFWAHPGRRGID